MRHVAFGPAGRAALHSVGRPVRVHTGRPVVRQAMVGQIADHKLLNVNGHNAEAALPDQTTHYAVELFDGATERRVRTR